jgi:hypothetical protein
VNFGRKPLRGRNNPAPISLLTKTETGCFIVLAVGGNEREFPGTALLSLGKCIEPGAARGRAVEVAREAGVFLEEQGLDAVEFES